MTKRIAIPYKDVKLRVVGSKAYFDAYRIQRLDFPATLPNTTINELGNDEHAGIVTDIPEVTATFQAFDVTHRIYSILCGESDWAAYPVAGLDVKNLGYVDLIGYVGSADASEMIKCIHLKYMRITDFTFTYTIDGESTEEYSCAGSEKRYLINDVRVESGELVGGVATLDYTPSQLRNDDYLLSFIVAGAWKNETELGSEADDEYTVDGVTVTLSGGDTEAYLAVYHTASGTMAFTRIAGGSIPAAIRGKNIPVTIYASNGDAEQQYRVQSVTIRGTFPNTKIVEMGNTSVVGYIVDVADVSGDITVLDTDNELVALLTTGARLGDSEGDYPVSEYETEALTLQIQLLDPADNTTIQKTVRIPEMRITSDGTTANVGGQLTQTFSFMSNTAECIVYSGAVPA